MKKSLIILLLLSHFGCNQQKSKEEQIAFEQTLRNKLIDSLTTIAKFDSLKQENAKLRYADSLISLEKSKEKSLTELYDSLKYSVVTVTTMTDTSKFSGTAFFINSNGTAVSNYHVFENTNKGFIETSNGNKYAIEKIIKSNKENDWIVFKVNTNGDNFQPLQINETHSKIGEKCFAIGSPKLLKLTMSEGIISGMRDNDNIIQTTTQITHGSSGGPLFNSKGEIIGITTMGADVADLNFAINIQKIKNEIIDFNSTNQSFTKKSTSDFYIISLAAVVNEIDASDIAQKYKERGFNASFLRMRDYKSLSTSGKDLYIAYIGPYQTKERCEIGVERFKTEIPEALGYLVTNRNESVVIWGIGKSRTKTLE